MKYVSKDFLKFFKRGIALVGMLGVVGTFTACSNSDNKEATEKAVREYESAQVYVAVSSYKTEREAQEYLHARGIYVNLSGYYETEEKTYDTPFSK